MSTSSPSIGCAVLTLNARHHLSKCLTPLLKSPLKPRVLVVDSSSTDGTAEIAQGMGAEILIIPREEFNHGTTREKARKHLNTSIVSMHTQDAYLKDADALEKMLKPIILGKAAIAYARQVPHQGADFFEAFPREYNYSLISHLRSIHDVDKYGIYTFFCSDSCAAYSNAVLDEIGGFPKVLLGEDTVATAKALKKGHHIAYTADAVVHHSHSYSLWEEFQRNFDTGLARKEYEAIIACEGTDTQRGMDYVRKMVRRLGREAPQCLPYAFMHIFAKWLGYKVGQKSVNAPVWLKRTLSSQSYFWKH